MASSEEVSAWERIERIALAEIDRRDERFRITTRNDGDELTASIRQLGLQVPPLVQRGPAGWSVLSGFRRVDACRRLGWEHLRARVAGDHCTPYELARLSVSENALARSLNLIEVSRSLTLLERFHPERLVPAEDLAAVGLRVNPALVARLRGLCRLPEALQEGVLEESIPFPMALEIGRLDPPTALLFARVLRQLKPSLNKQREIVSLVQEIAAREDRSVSEVLEHPEAARILNADEGDGNRTTAQLRGWLRRRRFPEMVRTEENFKALRGRLGLGGGAIRLTAPKDFEGSGFTLSLDFQSVEDIKRLRDRIDKLLRHPELNALVGGKRLGFRPDAAPRDPGKERGL